MDTTLVHQALDSLNTVAAVASDTSNVLLSSSIEPGFSLSSIFRGLIGLITIYGIAFLFSSNKREVNVRIILTGLAIQLFLCIGVLHVDFIQAIFDYGGKFFVKVLDFTDVGSTFLLGNLMDTKTYGFIFAFKVLPIIIFFSALTSLMFYLGVIQKFVYVLAWGMTRLLKISGAESLSVAGNIFLGQTESPLMIKAYLSKMNRSEMLLVMTGGMATLAGGVLASYIAFLGGDDPIQKQIFAKHLLTASVMAAPGAVVISKILLPQTEKVNTNVEVTKDKIGSNVLDAISNGTSEGLKLAVNVAGMLLVFIAMIAMGNYFLTLFGSATGLNDSIASFTDGKYTEFSFQFILGYLFSPIMWLCGVPYEDITIVGRLVGEKIILTEFISYISLSELKSTGELAFGSFVHFKSIIMATYMLCGFANFASIGIQIGGIGSLAPDKRKMLSELGLKALLGGTLASLLSATIIGMMY